MATPGEIYGRGRVLTTLRANVAYFTRIAVYHGLELIFYGFFPFESGPRNNLSTLINASGAGRGSGFVLFSKWCMIF